MKKKIKTTVLIIIVVGLALIQFGCGAGPVSKVGYLSDYSKLKAHSQSSLRYVNESALRSYGAFIVDDVDVHFHSGAKGIKDASDGQLTQQEIDDLTNYMHSVMVKAIEASGKRVAYVPGSRVARIRAAITDINKSNATNLIPTTKIAGVGLGGAALEVEVVDSQTGRQIVALVEAQKGSRIPFSGLGKWDAAKQAMDDWGRRMQKRLQ